MQNRVYNESIEFYDNRLSLFCSQYGKCAVSGEKLYPNNVHCHHIIPKNNGGNDSYINLILVTETIQNVSK